MQNNSIHIGGWQINCDPCEFAILTLYDYRTAVAFNYFFSYGKTKARAALFSCTRSVNSEKSVKHML